MLFSINHYTFLLKIIKPNYKIPVILLIFPKEILVKIKNISQHCELLWIVADFFYIIRVYVHVIF
jgi:hypothetical protein